MSLGSISIIHRKLYLAIKKKLKKSKNMQNVELLRLKKKKSVFRSGD